MMMKPCSCRGRAQDQRTQRKAILEASTRLVLIERRSLTPFHFGEREALQVALVNRTQQRREQ